MEHRCDKCKQLFACKKTLTRHLNKKFSCDEFTENSIKCEFCNIIIRDKKNKNQHLKVCKPYQAKFTQQERKPELKVNVYGKENVDYITDEEWKKIINSGFRSVERLIELYHFNKEHPENMNIHLLSLKNQSFLFYKKEADMWHAAITDEFLLDTLFNDKMNMILDRIEEKPVSDRLQKILTKLNDNIDRGYDSEMTKALKDKIKVFLITYNSQIKENHERDEKEFKKMRQAKNKT